MNGVAVYSKWMCVTPLRSTWCENIPISLWQGGGGVCVSLDSFQRSEARQHRKSTLIAARSAARKVFWPLDLPSSAGDYLKLKPPDSKVENTFSWNSRGWFSSCPTQTVVTEVTLPTATGPKPRPQITKTARIIISAAATWNNPVINTFVSDDKQFVYLCVQCKPCFCKKWWEMDIFAWLLPRETPPYYLFIGWVSPVPTVDCMATATF